MLHGLSLTAILHQGYRVNMNTTRKQARWQPGLILCVVCVVCLWTRFDYTALNNITETLCWLEVSTTWPTSSYDYFGQVPWPSKLTNYMFPSSFILTHFVLVISGAFPSIQTLLRSRTIEPFSHNESWTYSGNRTHTYHAQTRAI